MSASIVVVSLIFNDAATADKDQYIFSPDGGSWEPTKVTFTPDSDGAAVTDDAEWRKITGTINSVTTFLYTTDANGTPAGTAFVAGTAATLGTALVAGQLVTPTVPLKVASLHGGSTAKVCKGCLTVTLEKRHA